MRKPNKHSAHYHAAEALPMTLGAKETSSTYRQVDEYMKRKKLTKMFRFN